ncbi:AsmA family protein, partial [Candidatus Poribacteria bacterium]|nr:AsmA family protein [Candidatus Poribacteria bacterium]
MLTRRRKIILYIAATLLLFGIGGYFYISSDLFLNNFVKPRLIRALDEQIDDKYTMQIGHLQGNILTGVRIDDFSIDEKEGNGQSVMSTDSIVLRYNIWGLLQRKLLVSSLDIHTPIVKIYRDADGQVNISQVFQRTTSESDTSTDNTSITFAVSKVSLINGAMHYTDEQRNLDFKLPDIKIELDGSYEQWDHTGQFSVGAGRLTINQSTFNLDSIDDIKFSLSTEMDTLSRFKLRSGKTEIDIQNANFDRMNGEWNTSVKLTFNAEDIQKLLDAGTKIDGSGVIELDLQGTRSNIVGQIKGYSEGLSYSNNHHATSDVSVGHHLTNMTPIEVSAVNIDASLDLNEDQQLKINELSTVIADGSMSISGGVSFANTSNPSMTNLIERLQHYANNIISYTGQCKFDKVDLHSFLTMFTTLPSDSPRIENGIIQGSIQFSGDSEGNYHLDSLTRLLDVSLFVEGNTNDFISLDDSYVSCKVSVDSVNGSSVNASGVFDNIQVEVEGSIENFDTRLSNVDFGKLFRIANAIPIEGVGSASLNVNNASNNIHSVITGNAVIPETYFSHNVDDPIPIGQLSSDFRYADNTVHFEKGRLTHSTNNEDSKIQFDGKIRMAENMPVNFNINLDHFMLNTDYVRILFSEDYPIEG